MFDDIIAKYAVQFSVPEAWIRAVIETESNWKPQAYRAEPQISDASYGLMQLLSKTARGLGYEGDASGLFDPDTNIELGTTLLAQLRDRYGDDVQRVYSAYNSGSPDKYLTSAQVAHNVARFMGILETTVAEHPFVASTGLLAPALVFTALWFWKKKVGKK